MADADDSKSSGFVPWGFKSLLRHQISKVKEPLIQGFFFYFYINISHFVLRAIFAVE